MLKLPLTVRLTSIHLLQIGGKLTKTSGGSINLFYGCVYQFIKWTSQRNHKKVMAPLEVNLEFAPN
jgi:hypothetical protein